MYINIVSNFIACIFSLSSLSRKLFKLLAYCNCLLQRTSCCDQMHLYIEDISALYNYTVGHEMSVGHSFDNANSRWQKFTNIYSQASGTKTKIKITRSLSSISEITRFIAPLLFLPIKTYLVCAWRLKKSEVLIKQSRIVKRSRQILAVYDDVTGKNI